jgi:hypothetical protein
MGSSRGNENMTTQRESVRQPARLLRRLALALLLSFVPAAAVVVRAAPVVAIDLSPVGSSAARGVGIVNGK